MLTPVFVAAAKFCNVDTCLRLLSYSRLSRLNDIRGTTVLIDLTRLGSDVIAVKYLSFGPYDNGTLSFSFGAPACV